MATTVTALRSYSIPDALTQINNLFSGLTSHQILSVDIDIIEQDRDRALQITVTVTYNDAGAALTAPYVAQVFTSNVASQSTAGDMVAEADQTLSGIVYGFVAASIVRRSRSNDGGTRNPLYLLFLFTSTDIANGSTNWLATSGTIENTQQSLLFNGVDTYLSRNGGGSIIVIPSGSTYTIMQWHKMDPSIAQFSGLWGDNATQDYLQILSAADPRNFRFRADAVTVAQTASSFNTGVWQQTFARTRGTSSWGIYVNGDNNFATTAQATKQVTLDNIGVRGASRYWLGNITLMAIWNRNLTGTERNNLYGGGTPTDPAVTAPSGLIHLWYMDQRNRSTFPVIADAVGGVDLVMNNMSLANYVTDYP